MGKIWDFLKERFADEYMGDTTNNDSIVCGDVVKENSDNTDENHAIVIDKNVVTKNSNNIHNTTNDKNIVEEHCVKAPTKNALDIFLEHVEQHNKLVAEYRTKMVNDIFNTVQEHFSTLRLKYNQLSYTDDYGNVIDDDFMSEIDYFTKNVIAKVVPFHFSDSRIDADPMLWDSYSNLEEEYYNLPGEYIEEAEVKSNYVYYFQNFYAFELKLKGTEAEDDFNYRLRLNIIDKSYNVYSDDIYNEEPKVYYLRQVGYLVGFFFHGLLGAAIAVEEEIAQITNKDTNIESPETPLEYEKYITNQLKEMGFNARTTKASGDQGADVIAKKDGVSFAIQCKMYTGSVGNKAVQEANAGRDFYKCDYGVVVSNAQFTKSAKQAANACNIILLNDAQLDKLLDYTADNTDGK